MYTRRLLSAGERAMSWVSRAPLPGYCSEGGGNRGLGKLEPKTEMQVTPCTVSDTGVLRSGFPWVEAWLMVSPVETVHSEEVGWSAGFLRRAEVSAET